MSEGAAKKKRQSYVFWGVSSGMLLLYALGFPAGHYAVCSAKHSENEVPGYITIESNEGTDGAQAEKKTSAPKVPISPRNPSHPEKKQNANATYYPPRQPYDWGSAVLCDVNSSDYFVGLFTLILAISTIGLWLQTERLAEGADEQAKKMDETIAATNKIASETARIGEAQVRGYLSCQSAVFQMDERFIVVHPTLVNLGLTPATNVKIKGWLGTDYDIPDVTKSPFVILLDALTMNVPSKHAVLMWSIDSLNPDMRRRILVLNYSVLVRAEVEWNDVFGRPQTFVFEAHQPRGTRKEVPDLGPLGWTEMTVSNFYSFKGSPKEGDEN